MKRKKPSIHLGRNWVNTSAVRITMMIADIEERRHRPIDIKKVAVRSSLRSLKPKRTIESRAKRSSINLIRTLFHITYASHNMKTRVIIRVLRIIFVVLLELPSDTYVFIMKMEILLEPTSNKLMVQVKMEMEIPRSSGVYFITVCSYSTETYNDLMKAQKGMSMPVKMPQAQDDERPQVDDQRLDLADNLKEAQVHISSSITSHKTKVTTSKYKISYEESKTTS
ncbi:hypothetical protein Tco_0698797 [Tanacetum coccineum]